MGGPLSVARAVTDPRIMRNEPSHRPRAQTFPPALTWRHTGRRHFMYCRMPAHTSERFEGRRARIFACTGPQPTGASLLDIERPLHGSRGAEIPRERVFCIICI